PWKSENIRCQTRSLFPSRSLALPLCADCSAAWANQPLWIRGRGGIFPSNALVSADSVSLHCFAVNLINAHKAADKIDVLLVSERPFPGRPRQFARRFCMVGIVNEITFQIFAGAGALAAVDQHRVVDAHFWIRREKCHE